MHKYAWLSHYNNLEKQLLSTEGMESRESWEMIPQTSESYTVMF